MAAFICTTPGCGGPGSGVCINGLDFEECPAVMPMATDEAAAVNLPQGGTATAGAEALVSTGSVATLDASSCDAILRVRGGTVVGVVAGPEVGKTTMIATMYELIHRGRMTSYKFAGSETLRGYEERSYLARMGSNRAKADTPRTRTSSTLSFTHLRLATSDGFRDVIFSDRSGEHFEGVLNQPGGIAQFAELARANITLLLIDLHQLVKQPHLPTSQARRLFMAMEQNGLLAGKAVRLLGTKADLLDDGDETQKAREAIEDLAKDLCRRSEGRVQVIPLMIASRPRPGSATIGAGLEELLMEIFQGENFSSFHPGAAWPAQTSELDALMIPYRSNHQ